MKSFNLALVLLLSTSSVNAHALSAQATAEVNQALAPMSETNCLDYLTNTVTTVAKWVPTKSETIAFNLKQYHDALVYSRVNLLANRSNAVYENFLNHELNRDQDWLGAPIALCVKSSLAAYPHANRQAKLAIVNNALLKIDTLHAALK